jgi:uncharacterized protein YcgL (UPF0745 family)
MYLYVDAEEGLDRVPDDLLRRFGKPVEVMALQLTAEKRLARADVGEVMRQLAENGYYLQMPPSVVSEMQRLAAANSKLAR